MTRRASFLLLALGWPACSTHSVTRRECHPFHPAFFQLYPRPASDRARLPAKPGSAVSVSLPLPPALEVPVGRMGGLPREILGPSEVRPRPEIVPTAAVGAATH